MPDSPTIGAFNPSPSQVAEETQSEPTPIPSKDLQTYILAFWTSLPPLHDGTSSPSTPAPFNQTNHYDPQEKMEMELLYNAFIRYCRTHEGGKIGHTADTFEQTLKGRGKCYPWLVKKLPKDEAHDAGYAWYVALAIAALEVDEFSAGLKESVDDRPENAKKKVSEVVRGQMLYLDLAFKHAKGVALRKPPVEK